MSGPAGSVAHDDGNGHDYAYPPTGEMWPSVTTVLGATLAKPWIPPWAAGIAAQYAIDEMDTLARVKACRGRDAAIKLAKDESERIRDIKRDTGGYVHDIAEALVLWQASRDSGAGLALPELPEHLQGADYDGMPVEYVTEWMIDGYLNWVADYGPEFLAAEMTVFHPGLKVAGTLDQIVRLPGLRIGRAGRFIPGMGVTSCVDIKTGRHLDVTWPEQIAIYRRCPQCLLRLGSELYATPASDCGAVLHLRPEHPRGYRLMLISGADDAAAWNRARRAMELYDGRRAAKEKPGKVCYPLRADGTIPQPLIADLDGEGYGRAVGALVKAGLGGTDLEQLAAMTAGQLLAVKGIGGKTVGGARVMLADHGLHLKDEAPELKGAA